MLNLRTKTFINKSTMVSGLFLFLVAHAYAVNMQFLKYSPVSNFTSSDFEMLQTTGLDALINNEDGKVSSWKNPETNHSGTITPLDTTTIDDMHCRKTKITNQANDRSGQVVFTFCKIKDKWKVLK